MYCYDRARSTYYVSPGDGFPGWTHGSLYNPDNPDHPGMTWCGLTCGEGWYLSNLPVACMECLKRGGQINTKENDMSNTERITYKVTGLIDGEPTEHSMLLSHRQLVAMRCMLSGNAWVEVINFQCKMEEEENKPKHFQVWVSPPGINQTAKMIGECDTEDGARILGKTIADDLWVTIHDTENNLYMIRRQGRNYAVYFGM